MLLKRGLLPCRTCRRPHDYRAVDESPTSVASWAADDGHTYWPVSAEDVLASIADVLDEHDPDGTGCAKYGGDALLRGIRDAIGGDPS